MGPVTASNGDVVHLYPPLRATELARVDALSPDLGEMARARMDDVSSGRGAPPVLDQVDPKEAVASGGET